jgi:tetratricopeptide (TPR) repeat protein
LSVDFAPDNRLLVTAGERAVQVWSPGSFDAPVARYVVPLGYSQARLIPGRRAAVAGGSDGIVRIWDVDAPDSSPVELRGHEASIINIAVQAEGQLLATASEDGKVLLWQLDQPEAGPLRELDARGTNRIEFVSSGELITSGYGPTALWNLADLSEPPITLPGSGQAPSYWTAVNENEDAVATIAQDGIARIWPLGSGRLIDIACRIANSNLEYRVWRDAYGEMPYARTCKNLPVHMSVVDAGKTLAAAGDVDKAVELLTHAVELDAKIIDVAPQQMVADIAVESMLKRGKALARDGKVIAASVQFERAKALNDDAVSNPSVYANQLAYAKLHMQHGKKMAGEGRYEIAVANFITARGLDPDIDVDPAAEAVRLIVPYYLGAAERAARNLNIDSAIKHYRKVVELDPDRTLDPVIEASRRVARSYRSSAERTANGGDVDLAIELYEKALALDPTLDIEPRAETRRRAAPTMARRAVDELRDGRVDAGMAQLRDAMRARPNMEITAECWNLLCWNGLLWNRADAVTDACERAIATGPDDADLRDTRGVLRVLSGELLQAIPDFEAYVEAYKDERVDRVAQRREWITALKAGRNPLTEAELTRLREANNGIWFGMCTK